MSATAPTDTRDGDVRELLRRLDSWLYLRVEHRPDCVILRVHDVVVGTLSPASGTLSVPVPRDMVDVLLECHQQLRSTGDGVSLPVRDADSCTAAEELLRWRVELARYAPQLRAASP